jgi:hypothetical protein
VNRQAIQCSQARGRRRGSLLSKTRDRKDA